MNLVSNARRCLRAAELALVLAGAAGAGPAQSAPPEGGDGGSAALSWSVFGTLGYAVSDRSWGYQRFIDHRGTTRRDSVLGAQLDLQLTPQWSATLQPRLAPSERHESGWDLTPAWAFAAWRPDNDWLVRAGKLRVPFLLRSEQLSVGQTYADARLPAEVYSIVPASDFTGLHVTRNWGTGGDEFSANAYRGSVVMNTRVWLREGLPPAVPGGAAFPQLRITLQGLVFDWHGSDAALRAGVHEMRVSRPNGTGLLASPAWAGLGGGQGYWQTSNALPGPGVGEVDSAATVFLTAGGELALGRGWRVAAELIHGNQRDVKAGLDLNAGYLTLYHGGPALTAYATAGAISPGRGTRQWLQRLDTTVLPATLPGAATLNASMRAYADRIPAYDQRSLALGAAWALTPRSTLKAEWLHVHVRGPRFMDTPAHAPMAPYHRVNVLSLGYSFAY